MKSQSVNVSAEPASSAQQARAQARRDQIVAAAKVCFRHDGFHGASMGNIAAEAKLSVGQIYRYFVNKEAIIEAIVERIVTARLTWIESTGGIEDLPRVMARRLVEQAHALPDDDIALLMEATAEATRNPAVADIVRAADRRLHARAEEIMARDYPALTARDIAARVEVMAVLSEGTLVRTVSNTFGDLATLEHLYRQLLAALVPEAPSLTRKTKPATKAGSGKERNAKAVKA